MVRTMIPIEDLLALIDRAGMPAIRRTSTLLTNEAIEIAHRILAPLGVSVASPAGVCVCGMSPLGHQLMHTVYRRTRGPHLSRRSPFSRRAFDDRRLS